MTITLRTDLRSPAAPAALAQFHTLWRADGAAHAPAWEGLAGPSGAAAGDQWPTRTGDRAHPAAPATAAVDDAAEVVAIASPAVMAAELARAAGPSELVTRWFAPGTIAAAPAVDLAGRAQRRTFAVKHTAPGGASILGAHRPLTTAGAAGVGALVLWRDGGAWRPGIVAGVA